MDEKMFNTRIIHKHDTQANWEKAVNFIPKQGELIVYDPDENYSYSRAKIGDGITGVNNLIFLVDKALQSDWEQHSNTEIDYIKNRTHYDSRTEELKAATFDGTLEGKDSIDLGNGQYFVKFSEDAPSIENIVGMNGTVYVYGDILTQPITLDMIVPMNDIVYMVADILAVVLEDTEIEGLSFTKGCWSMVLIEESEAVYYGKELNYKITNGELKTLDIKYLPEEAIITEKEVNQICMGTLDEAPWDRISRISNMGKAANYWSIGDCKAVHLKGTVGTKDIDQTLYLYILGFDHNAEKEGYGISFGGFKTANGKNGIDICLMDDYYNQGLTNGTKAFNMQHWGYRNYGGWARCDLRYDILGSTDVAPQGYGAIATEGQVGYDATENCTLNPVANTLMSCLPEELRKVMKPITKYTDNVGGGTGHVEDNISGVVDYLPLLGEYEIFTKESGAYAANEYEQNYQKQYEYYAMGNSRVKYLDTDNATSAWWWERSPYYTGTTNFCSVYTNGGAGSGAAGGSFGIAPALLV